MSSVQVQFGGKQGFAFNLETNEDLVAIRTWDAAPVAAKVARLSGAARDLLGELELVTRFDDAGVEVFHVRTGTQGMRDAVRSTFKNEPDIRFAGRVLADPIFKPEVGIAATRSAAPTQKQPVLYSENIFVKFASTMKASAAKKILAAYNLKVAATDEVNYSPNAWFVKAAEGIGLAVFDLALQMPRDNPEVQLCHPELLRVREFRRAAFPQQWHLKKTKIGGTTIDAHANVEAAWSTSVGKDIVIAVIDDGVDIDHLEFQGTKVVHPRDITLADPNPRPKLDVDNHGTACAGVACASGKNGASGVAPGAKLMPIRLRSALGSQREADAFAWAVDKGADVISCSWGPKDGRWWDPTDPTHQAPAPISDNVRLAIEYALTQGRGGKGCVICWAAGNGNESADLDSYVSLPGVIGVAACNDTGKRSVYSDTGKAVWCSFPSNDFSWSGPAVPIPNPPPQGGVWTGNHPAPLTPGIWTTDRSGNDGYNRGQPTPAGDDAGDYTEKFGGTSSACPGVAGVAALILAANPSLTAVEVKNILKDTAKKIDTAGGAYDASGHSELYGYGRVDAAAAVNAAVAAAARAPAGPAPARALAARAKRAKTKAAKKKAVRARHPMKGSKAAAVKQKRSKAQPAKKNAGRRNAKASR